MCRIFPLLSTSLFTVLTYSFLTQTPILAQPTTDSSPSPNNLPAGASIHAPIQGGSVVSLDLPDSSAQNITLQIVKGRFSNYSVGKMDLKASGIDFKNGTLAGLSSIVTDGDFDNMFVSRFEIVAPAFSFDTMQLLNSHTFVLSQPVSAQVNLVISQDGMNHFISNPKTLSKLTKSVQKQTGGIQLITFANPNFTLLGNNQVKLTMVGTVAQGLAVPLEMTGHLDIANGQLIISHLVLTSGGNELQLPVDLAKVFEDKINELIDFKRLGKNSLVITAEHLKSVGKNLMIDGHATLTRLQFGA